LDFKELSLEKRNSQLRYIEEDILSCLFYTDRIKIGRQGKLYEAQ